MRQMVYLRIEFWPTNPNGQLGYEVIKPALQSTGGRIAQLIQSSGPESGQTFTTSDGTVLVILSDVGNMQVP